jgi:hypothetical protein
MGVVFSTKGVISVVFFFWPWLEEAGFVCGFPLPGELVRVCYYYYCYSKPEISRLLLLYSKSL